MPAYVIAIREKTRNPEEIAAYGAAARGARDGHKITPRAFYGPQVVLEGPTPEGVAILEFPSVEEARAWYDSPAYQAILPLRTRHIEGAAIIVDGVPADYDAAETARRLRSAA